MKKNILALSTAFYFSSLMITPSTLAKSLDELILLGTGGGPVAKKNRSGISSLIKINGKSYLIDAGVGTVRQLALSDTKEGSINAVFITHLHDDHTADLPAWMTFVYTSILNKPPKKFTIFGPPEINTFISASNELLDVNGKIRRAEQKSKLKPQQVFFSQIISPGVFYKDNNVTVSAIENTHYDLKSTDASSNKSYSLKFKTPNRIIVFTGDTGPSNKVADFAKGADILVSEMVTRKLPPDAPESARLHIEKEHLSPLEVGKLAQKAGVKKLVLSHISLVTNENVMEIKKNYTGEIVVGVDLMKF